MTAYEFNNRMTAQREILSLVNSKVVAREELFGLSSKSIDRWVSVNALDRASIGVALIIQLSDKLFFLANKSQEQISPEYQNVKIEIADLCQKLDGQLSSEAVGQSSQKD